MTSQLSLRAACERAAKLNNPDITLQTEEAAKLLSALCDAVKDLDIAAAPWTGDDVMKAALGKKTLLERSVPAVTAAQFSEVGRRLAAAYLETVQPSDDIRAAVNALAWDHLTTNAELTEGLGHPARLTETLVNKTDERIRPAAALLIALSLRALLESSAARASDLFAQAQKDTVHFERPTHCPVCGSPAAIASVSGTANHGNVKTLYCTTCGAHWPFERIRCAACGDEAVSDLTYVHDDKDDTRRLHVCRHCRAAFPTIFVADAEQFDPDIDGIAVSGLVEWYEAHCDDPENQI